MAELKGAYEEAEQEYKQHRELINSAADEADVKKVDTKLTTMWLMQLYIYFFSNLLDLYLILLEVLKIVFLVVFCVSVRVS